MLLHKRFSRYDRRAAPSVTNWSDRPTYGHVYLGRAHVGPDRPAPLPEVLRPTRVRLEAEDVVVEAPRRPVRRDGDVDMLQVQEASGAVPVPWRLERGLLQKIQQRCFRCA